MLVRDWAPTEVPSCDHQRDALRKGLGRAWVWAMRGQLDVDLLEEACVRDWRFEQELDWGRGAWLWQIIQELGAEDRLRAAILAAFRSMADERNAGQVCELAYFYARSGDLGFRERLYEVVASKPMTDYPSLGESELIRLDSTLGFLLAARSRGARLEGKDWNWEDDIFMRTSAELLGVESVDRSLRDSEDLAIRRLHEGWVRQRERMEPPDRAAGSQDLDVLLSVLQIIKIAESDSGDADSNLLVLSRWGERADDVELQIVLERLWGCDEPKVMRRLLRIFGRRAIPTFDERLIELCQHLDAGVRFQAIIALANVTHEAVREFAVSQLRSGGLDPNLIGLFVQNYQSGDADRILEALRLPEDDIERHTLLCDVLVLLEKRPQAPCAELGILAYAETPCGHCRFELLRLLHSRGAAPAWLVDECRFDVEPRCRELALRATSGF